MIIGLSGAIGSGKSHTQLKVALEYCERKQKQLVTNFPVNARAVYNYAKLNEYKWVQRLALRGSLIQINSPQHLEALLIPESVVCLDEAGIFLNSREFASTSKRLLADLAQSRKDGVDLVWAAQFNEQVDKQVRLLTQYWVHCDSLATYDKQLRRPKLFWKRIYWFTAWNYNFWVNDPRARSAHFKTRFAHAFKYEGGFLTQADKALFKAFDSFNRLDLTSSGDVIRTLARCDLPKDYYFNAKPLEFLHTPAAAKPEVSAPRSPRSQMIRQALNLAKKKQISAPFFKQMPDAQIQAFIDAHTTPRPN